MKKIIFFIICLMSVASMAQAQKTCVIASAEDHVPISKRDAHGLPLARKPLMK